MRRLIYLSFLLQGGKNVNGYTDAEINSATIMYNYVNLYSGGFTCHYKYLETLWLAAYFKVAGYEG
jgi:hypothetical protein